VADCQQTPPVRQPATGTLKKTDKSAGLIPLDGRVLHYESDHEPNRDSQFWEPFY
jgi:hypothetical protein